MRNVAVPFNVIYKEYFSPLVNKSIIYDLLSAAAAAPDPFCIYLYLSFPLFCRVHSGL